MILLNKKWVMEKKNKDKRIAKNNYIENKNKYKLDMQVDQYNLLQTLINNIPDHIYIKDKKNRFIMVNKAKADFEGEKPSDFIGKTDFDFFPQKNAKEYFKDDNQIIQEGKPIIDKVVKVIHTGKEFWVSSSKIPWYDRSGNIMGTMGISRDITQRKQSLDNLLKESEEKYKNLFESSPVGIITMDTRGIITACNKLIFDFTGCAIHEIIGKHFKKIKVIKFKNITQYIRLFTEFLAGKKIKPFLINWKHKDGRNFTGEVRTSPIKKNKKIVGVQIIILNMTENIKIEKELRDSEEFKKNILENSPSPIYVINPDKSIGYVNPALERITGFSSKELIGKKPPRPYWVKGMESTYISTLEDGMKNGTNNLELPFVNKKGQKFWVEITALPIKSNKKLKYLLVNIIDITERKQAYSDLGKTLDDTINTLASIVETRDPYTAGHQKRVTALAVKIAQKLNIGNEKIKFLRIAAAIHDIGKINIPPSILSRPGKLSDIEFSIVKTHSQIGSDIVKNIEFFQPIARIILQHHEREDGSGYPDGLKGKDITLEAKIIGVADVVEAMSSHRPYRPALSIKMAIDEIKKNKGKLYDPEVVESCLEVITDKKFSFE